MHLRTSVKEVIDLSHFNVRKSYAFCATKSYRDTFTTGLVYDESNILATPFLQIFYCLLRCILLYNRFFGTLEKSGNFLARRT